MSNFIKFGLKDLAKKISLVSMEATLPSPDPSARRRPLPAAPSATSYARPPTRRLTTSLVFFVSSCRRQSRCSPPGPAGVSEKEETTESVARTPPKHAKTIACASPSAGHPSQPQQLLTSPISSPGEQRRPWMEVQSKTPKRLRHQKHYQTTRSEERRVSLTG